MHSLDQEFSSRFRVYYEETDAAQVVYHANFLCFFERARTDFFLELGFIKNNKSAFVVRRVEIDYLKPIRLYDEIVVACKIIKVTGTSVIFKQSIYLEKDPEILFGKGLVTVVHIDENLRPKRLPQEFLNLQLE